MTQPDQTSSPTVNEDTLHWNSGGSEPTRDLTGRTLGDFEVQRLLGKGGMGEVYLARQISLNRSVALKVLRPDLVAKPGYITRFEAEATAVAKLNHPNIVHVYTLGASDDIRFIAMEYVQGTNLKEFIAKKGALDYPVALSIMKQAGVAVGAAGELGLVHRDIKPENLLLTKKGQVKVADFGLCRDIDAERHNLTQPGITMGTPTYMSPEQAQGLALDHRSDLYSLGVTFYHMLTAEVPFKGESPIAVALKHVKDVPPSLAVFRSDIPPELDRLVLKLMMKSPADRYQSAAEMLRDLARAREALHTPSGAQSFADLPGPPTLTTTPPAATVPLSTAAIKVATTHDPSRPWIGPRLGTGLVVLGLILGAGVGWASRPEDLLKTRAVDPSLMPGLWIAPAWASIEQQKTAEEQYRYAQMRAPIESIDAAWLAVPGHFHDAKPWTTRAYTQLARHVLGRRDVERLAVLAEEIDRWNGTHTHEKELANLIRAGVDALEGDADGVLNTFDTQVVPDKITDPALLELSLEVANQAERVAKRGGAANSIALKKLHALQEKLYSQLSAPEPRVTLMNRAKSE